MESSCEKISANRAMSSPPIVTTSSIIEATVTMSTASTVKGESEICSRSSSLLPETNQLTKKRRTSSSINDQEKNNDNQQLSKCHSSAENSEETNTCKNSGTSNCGDNKKSIYVDESSSEIHQNNDVKTCDIVGSNDELLSLNVDSKLCETEFSVDNADSERKAESSRVTAYANKLSSMATSPLNMMPKDSSKDESEQNLKVSSSATTSDAINPRTITTETSRSPTSVIVKPTTKKATVTSTSTSSTTTITTKSLSSESSLKTVTTTNSTAITTIHCESKQEDENKIDDKNVNNIVIKEEMRSNQMDECDDNNINDLKKQELCSSDSTNSTAINDTKCNSIIGLSSSSESSNGDSINIQKSVQTLPLLVDDHSTATLQENIETSDLSTSYISKDNDQIIKNCENSNDDADRIDLEEIPIEKTSAISTSTTVATTKAETTKTTLSATVEPAVEGISFGLDNILSKAKTPVSNLGVENSVSSRNPSPSLLSQHLTSNKNDIITMSTSPKDLDTSSLQKPGRWNTMHVRISWEILRQQKASQGEKSNKNSPLSTSFNLKSPTILPSNSSSSASASTPSIALPTTSKNSHLPYDLIRPPTANIFGNLTSVLQTPQSQQQNPFQPQLQSHSHSHSQPPPLHHHQQQIQLQPSNPHSRSLEISSFSASLMNAASGGHNSRLSLDPNLWNQRSLFGPVSLASSHLPYPSLQAPLSSSSLSYTAGSSIPPTLALSSSSSTSSVSTPSITAPISSIGKINGNNDILRSTNSIFGLPPRPGEMTPFSTSLYNAAVAAAGHRPGLEAWNAPFAPGPGMSSIAAHNFIRSSLPGFPGFPHPHSNPHSHSPHNNLGLPGSVPTSMSNNLFANLAPPQPQPQPQPQPSHSSLSSMSSSSNMESLLNTSGRPGSSIFPPIGREEHLPPISSSSGCGSVPGSGSSSSSSTSTSWGGLKAEAEKSEYSKHKDGTNRSISSRSKDEIRSDTHHHHHHSHRSSSNSSSINNKIGGSKHSSLNHNGDSETSHRREREKSHSNSHKREYSRPSSVSSVSSGNKMMKTSSSAFNDNRSSHTHESKAKDERRESMNNYNKYFDRSHKHSSNSTERQGANSSGVSNLPQDFLNTERDWEYRCQLAGLTESMIPGMTPYPVSLTRDYQNAIWDPLSQPYPSSFLEQERIFQRYNILNSSGGGAPLTEKLAKEGPFQALSDKESRSKEMTAFPPAYDRCAQYPLTNLIPAPNQPSLQGSPFGGPGSLSHGPGNLGLGHALPPPPPGTALPSLPQSHPHPSSYHQLYQHQHLNQTSPGQPPSSSSSSVLMFPPNPYLNSLHSLSASAGSNVRTDLNNRTKSLSS